MLDRIDRTMVANELRALAESCGGVLKPEDVVEAAKPPSSPLHSHFEWSDTVAAQQYRLQQARTLLRVVVTVKGDDARTLHLPVFTSLSTERGSGYRPTEEVRADPDMSLQADLDTLRDVERRLVRANSPRLTGLLHQTALLLAQLETQQTSPPSLAPEKTVVPSLERVTVM